MPHKDIVSSLHGYAQITGSLPQMLPTKFNFDTMKKDGLWEGIWESTDDLLDNVNDETGNGLTKDQRISILIDGYGYLRPEYEYGDYDCSKLVQEVYRANGIELERTSRGQKRQFENAGWYVPASEINKEILLPGDLAFWYYKDTGKIGHVAIYLGSVNGEDYYIESGTNAGPKIAKEYKDRERGRYLVGYGIIR